MYTYVLLYCYTGEAAVNYHAYKLNSRIKHKVRAMYRQLSRSLSNNLFG